MSEAVDYDAIRNQIETIRERHRQGRIGPDGDPTPEQLERCRKVIEAFSQELSDIDAYKKFYELFGPGSMYAIGPVLQNYVQTAVQTVIHSMVATGDTVNALRLVQIMDDMEKEMTAMLMAIASYAIAVTWND